MKNKQNVKMNAAILHEYARPFILAIGLLIVLYLLVGCATVCPYNGESSTYEDKDKNTEGVGVVVPW